MAGQYVKKIAGLEVTFMKIGQQKWTAFISGNKQLIDTVSTKREAILSVKEVILNNKEAVDKFASSDKYFLFTDFLIALNDEKNKKRKKKKEKRKLNPKKASKNNKKGSGDIGLNRQVLDTSHDTVVIVNHCEMSLSVLVKDNEIHIYSDKYIDKCGWVQGTYYIFTETPEHTVEVNPQMIIKNKKEFTK